jgi:NHL repeat
MSTIAGNRTNGTTDGEALSASFMQPAAVAFAPDGALIIVDASAHNVRRLFDGRVTTIAGHARPGQSAQYRRGGFRDGNALDAEFNRPVGVAVGKSGAVYIADANNFRIRKLFHGLVTTFAGKGIDGYADGNAATAIFHDPNGIAVDDDENVYVADTGIGIRKITPDGNVSTLVGPHRGDAVSIAARGSGKGLILAYSTKSELHLIADGQDKSLPAMTERVPLFAGYTSGYSYGVAIINSHLLITTDIGGNAVRYVRFPNIWAGSFEVRALAGGVRDAADPVGGYRDGPPEAALVRGPMGIALLPNGSIVVADSGNRLLRQIDNVSTREIISRPDVAPSYPPDTYRIAFVASSIGDCCSALLWPETIPGTIETGLIHDYEKLRLPKKPYLNGWRIDATSATGMHSFIINYLGDGQADLVLYTLHANLIENELNANPSLKVKDAWKKFLAANLRELAATLRKSGTKLVLVTLPDGEAVSPLERMDAFYPQPSYDFAAMQTKSRDLEPAVKNAGLPTITLLDPMMREAESPDRTVLYYDFDRHLSRGGAHWIGAEIVRQLEVLQPWLTP